MNIFRRPIFRVLFLSMALPAFALLAGCNVDSIDSTSAVLSDNSGTIYNFSGLYMNPNNSTSTNGVLPIVFPNQGNHKPTGELIRSMRMLQYGSVLEAYDSAGLTWYGNISGLQGTAASFTLSGRTTVGNPVEIAGTMNYADQKSTLNATWIEPNYFGSIIAEATVTPANTNTPVSGLNITPNSTPLSGGQTTVRLTARDGSGSYSSWEVTAPSLGTVNPTTGASVTYTSTGITGNNTITVIDSTGTRATATVRYQ